MFPIFMPKQCVSCLSSGSFLCVFCKKRLSQKGNIRLFHLHKKEDIIDEILLWDFHMLKSRIKIVILYEDVDLGKLVTNNCDTYRLREFFEILKQKLVSLCHYQPFTNFHFFSEYKTPFIRNTFLYSFMKFLKKQHNICSSYKYTWSKFFTKKYQKEKKDIIIMKTFLTSSLEKFVCSKAFHRQKEYFIKASSITFIFLFRSN